MNIFWILTVSILLGWSNVSQAETLVLHSGQRVAGRIVEQNSEVVKIDLAGIVLTYDREDIASIEETTEVPEANAVIVPYQSEEDEMWFDKSKYGSIEEAAEAERRRVDALSPELRALNAQRDAMVNELEKEY
jgi:hypothetical protein